MFFHTNLLTHLNVVYMAFSPKGPFESNLGRFGTRVAQITL